MRSSLQGSTQSCPCASSLATATELGLIRYVLPLHLECITAGQEGCCAGSAPVHFETRQQPKLSMMAGSPASLRQQATVPWHVWVLLAAAGKSTLRHSTRPRISCTCLCKLASQSADAIWLVKGPPCSTVRHVAGHSHHRQQVGPSNEVHM